MWNCTFFSICHCLLGGCRTFDFYFSPFPHPPSHPLSTFKCQVFHYSFFLSTYSCFVYLFASTSPRCLQNIALCSHRELARWQTIFVKTLSFGAWIRKIAYLLQFAWQYHGTSISMTSWYKYLDDWEVKRERSMIQQFGSKKQKEEIIVDVRRERLELGVRKERMMLHSAAFASKQEYWQRFVRTV